MRDIFFLLIVTGCLAPAIRYPFIGVLVWTWFTITNAHQLTYGGLFGVPFNQVIAAATLAVLAAHGRFARLRGDPTIALLVLFTVWILISQVFSVVPENSARQTDLFIKALILVLLVVQFVDTRLKIHALLWVMTLGLALWAGKSGIFTLLTLGAYRVSGPAQTMIADNNHFGIAMATMLPLTLYLAGEARNRLARLGLVVLGCFLGLTVLGTYSRGAMVSLAVFGGYLWLRSRRKILMLVCLAGLGWAGASVMPEEWFDRMGTIKNAEEDASFRGRLDAWEINWALGRDYPLTGVGLRNSYITDVAALSVDYELAQRTRAAHSIYFEVLGGTGFVGLTIYLMLLGNAWLTARWLASPRSLKAGADPWMQRFGYYAQISLSVFMVGGSSTSMEAWEGYLIVIALISVVRRLALKGAPQEEREDVASGRWRFRTRGLDPRGRTKPRPGAARPAPRA